MAIVPLKISPDPTDFPSTREVDPVNDVLAMAGIDIENLGTHLIDRSGTNLTFQDPATGVQTLTQLALDEKAKVSANDTTAGFLNGKLVAGTFVTLTEQNDGGNETLRIGLSGIARRINFLCAPSGNVLGSSSNAANQLFNVSLAPAGFQIGDTVRIGSCYFRGDFSGGNEFVDVGFNSTGDPKGRVGEEAPLDVDGDVVSYVDTARWFVSHDLLDRSYTVVDIGAGVPGIQVYVSPSSAVNFSPGGMPSGFWWQLKFDFLAV